MPIFLLILDLKATLDDSSKLYPRVLKKFRIESDYISLLKRPIGKVSYEVQMLKEMKFFFLIQKICLYLMDS